MTQKLGSKPIIYLDQNWLSEITKALLPNKRSQDKTYFQELFGVIQNGVTSDKFVTPMSDFHESESSLSSELDAYLRSVDNILSRGLTFNEWFGIGHVQLMSAALLFAGAELPAMPWWQIPFNRDPDIPDGELGSRKAGMEVYIRMTSLIDEWRRLRNESEAPMYRDYKEARKSVGLSFEGEFVFSKAQLLWEGYFGVRQAIAVPGVTLPDWDVMYQGVATHREQQWREIQWIINQSQNPAKFFVSSDFNNAHFINIRAKLMAADITKFPARKPEPSLLDDFSIVATILPYSDVFATESYIAELIRQTKLDDHYSCRVFSMRQKDEFLDNVLES